MWHGSELDLDRYLGYIGFDGVPAPTVETLLQLHRAHVLAVKWENLDAYLHHAVSLDLVSVADKLLSGRRGGYCYEHVTLYAAVLERIGFEFHAIAGRVQLGATQIRPATHAMLVVTVDGTRWLADVGFGASPLRPFPLADHGTVNDGTWAYRLRRGEWTPQAHVWALDELVAQDEWRTRHTFGLEPQYPIDFRVGNHFVASDLRSPFATRLFVQRLLPDRVHVLDHLTLTTQIPGAAAPPVREFEPSEIPGVLTSTFGIELAPEDQHLLQVRLTEPPRV